MKNGIVILLYILTSWNSYAQDLVIIDSLKKELNSTSTKEDKALILAQISLEFRVSNPDSAMLYVEQGLALIPKDTTNETYIRVSKVKSTAYIVKGQYTKAKKILNTCLRYYTDKNEPLKIADCISSLGSIDKYTSNIDGAIENYLTALKIYEEENNLDGMSACYGTLGQLFEHKNDLESAVSYTEKEVEIAYTLKNDKLIGHSLTNLGIIYSALNQHEKAAECYEESIIYKTKLGDTLGVSINLNNWATVLAEHGDLNLALEKINEAIEIAARCKSKMWVGIGEVNKADIQRRLKNYKGGLITAQHSLSLAKEIEYPELISADYQVIMETYKEMGDFEKALEYADLYHAIEKEIANKSNSNKIAEMKEKYESEKKDKEIISLNAEKQLKNVEIENAKIEANANRVQKIALFGGLAITTIFGFVIFNRFRLTHRQKETIELQKAKVDNAYAQLEEKNSEILDSINYAQRLQKAILPAPNHFNAAFPENFILFMPKDVVSGDFYWFEKIGKTSFIACADCTGHGVPGALVSIVCAGALSRSVKEFNLKDPGKILDKTRELVVETFAKSGENVNDGMDIALCAITDQSIEYAGANNPLIIIRNDEIHETKADKQPIGKYDLMNPFTSHKFKLEKNDSIYLFSDGYVDQFGGPKGKKLKSKQFKDLILKGNQASMKIQKENLETTFTQWLGDFEQVDDVCVIGIRI